MHYAFVLKSTKYNGNEKLKDGMIVSGKIDYKTPRGFVLSEYWLDKTEKKKKSLWKMFY